jgi:hypothetical protein
MSGTNNQEAADFPLATDSQLSSGAVKFVAILPGALNTDGTTTPAEGYSATAEQLATVVTPLVVPPDFDIVEITSDTTLVSATHKGKLLVVSAPNVTLTAPFSGIGSGFSCAVANVSGGSVVMGGMVDTSNTGATRLANGAQGWIVGFQWSGGNRVNWGGSSVL